MLKTTLIAPLLAGLALGGCMTQRVKPPPSPAVLEARAHALQARAHPASICASVTVDPTVPLDVPFAYDKDDLTDPGRDALDQAAAWLICKPAAFAAIVGESDPTGTAERRRAVAAARVAAARAYLTAHGVAPARLLAAKPASGEVLAINAKGRGW